jgi:Flp pilus assembly protein TadB
MTTIYVIAGVAALLLLLVAVAIYRRRKANAAPTRAHRVAAPKMSQREAVEKIRAGEQFVLTLPGGRHVAVPRPENIAYWGGLVVLAAVGTITWPLAVIIGAGDSITSRSKRARGREMAAEIDELRTEIRRLAEMLTKNGEGDQPPAEVC